MAITTGDDRITIEKWERMTTTEKWERMIKDMAPGFLKNRKRQIDKEIKKATKKKKK